MTLYGTFSGPFILVKRDVSLFCLWFRWSTDSDGSGQDALDLGSFLPE